MYLLTLKSVITRKKSSTDTTKTIGGEEGERTIAALPHAHWLTDVTPHFSGDGRETSDESLRISGRIKKTKRKERNARKWVETAGEENDVIQKPR
jgi:hypothetical protein